MRTKNKVSTITTTNIDRWFTREEQFLLIDQIKQVLELSNFRIGDTDDQALLMTLFMDEIRGYRQGAA